MIQHKRFFNFWSDEMTDNVGFAGQIGPEHVEQVVEKGFKSIINNRPDMEGGP